jgi:hypothetical protein
MAESVWLNNFHKDNGCFPIMEAKHKINLNYFQNIFTFQKKGYFCGTKRDRMSEKRTGKGASGRKPLWAVNPETGEETCQLSFPVDRGQWELWNTLKKKIELKAGYSMTNQQAFDEALSLLDGAQKKVQ